MPNEATAIGNNTRIQDIPYNSYLFVKPDGYLGGVSQKEIEIKFEEVETKLTQVVPDLTQESFILNDVEVSENEYEVEVPEQYRKGWALVLITLDGSDITESTKFVRIQVGDNFITNTIGIEQGICGTLVPLFGVSIITITIQDVLEEPFYLTIKYLNSLS